MKIGDILVLINIVWKWELQLMLKDQTEPHLNDPYLNKEAKTIIVLQSNLFTFVEIQCKTEYVFHSYSIYIWEAS